MKSFFSRNGEINRARSFNPMLSNKPPERTNRVETSQFAEILYFVNKICPAMPETAHKAAAEQA